MGRRTVKPQIVPKRRIERVRSTINTVIGTGTTEKILHAAEDTKTLVRTLIQLTFSPVSATDENIEVACMYSVHPKSIGIVGPSVSESLDNPVPLQEITQFNFAWNKHLTTSGAMQGNFRWDADIKAMRKLKELDELVLAFTADVDTSFNVNGTIYQWFKE